MGFTSYSSYQVRTACVEAGWLFIGREYNNELPVCKPIE